MNISKTAAAVLSAVMILCFAAPAANAVPSVTGETSHTERTLYNGVQYAEIKTASGTKTYADQHINVVTFDLKQRDLYLEPAYYNDRGVVNYSYSTVGGIIKDYNGKNSSSGKKAIAAVNGDMWLSHWALGNNGNLTEADKAKTDITICRSFNMVNGEIYASETTRREIAIETGPDSQNSWSFGITDDYVPIFGQPHTVITVLDETRGKSAVSDGINRFPVNDTLLIYTDRLMSVRRDFVKDDAYEILVEFDADYTLGADTAVTGTLKAIYDKNTTENPPYLNEKQMVITARGNKISGISSFGVGDKITVSVRVTDYAGDNAGWSKVHNAVSGSLPLVKDGVVKSAEIDLVASPGYPSTIIGHDRSGKTVFITMDGRGKGGAGGSAARYKQIIKDYDLYNALLLDGGGSMTMVTATDNTYSSYKTVSTPSDGADRTVDDALILAFGPERAPQGEFLIDDPYYTTDPYDITFPSDSYVKAFREFANQTEMSCEDGALKLTVSGSAGKTFDPYIILNFDKLANKASASEYKFVTLVYKMPTTNSRRTTGPDYYGTEVCREYYGSNPKQFTYMTDQYEYVTFDLSSAPDWKGDITKLRIDYMFASGRDGDTMYIHNIIFSKSAQQAKTKGASAAEALNASAILPGDCNGDGATDNKDVVLLFRYVSGTPVTAVKEALDFNGDGEVNNKDVAALFRYASQTK